jgi:hypothetical protein
MNRPLAFLALLCTLALKPTAIHAAATAAEAGAARPNIVWLVAEDMSPHFGCYGEKTIETPNVDKLAKNGLLFERAFVTGPICSPSRSAMIDRKSVV